MSSDALPEIPKQIQPNPDEYEFDLQHSLQSVVSVRARIPEQALTASVLGTEREGHGVVIDDQGLILTIGYVITEAESVWLVDHTGVTSQGYVVAYDQESGFGLVKSVGDLNLPVCPLGKSANLTVGSKLVLAGAGGVTQSVEVELASVREFAGYWEYLIDGALFTAPAHPFWGGAALIGEEGQLFGIGSLILQTQRQRTKATAANMVIPIDLLSPILDELKLYGRRNKPGRPWLGWYVQEQNDTLIVAGVVDDGPAEQAGIQPGDVVLSINGQPVPDLPTMYRSVWSSGDAGVEVSVQFQREHDHLAGLIVSVDRNAMLLSGSVH